MTSRRRNLLIGLIPLVGVLFVGIVIGPVEFAIWLALVVAWVGAFFTWGKRTSAQSLSERQSEQGTRSRP